MNDPIWRPILGLVMLLLTLARYAALVAAVAQLARNVLRAGSQPGWVRLGLVLGGIFSFYAVLANALGTFFPAPDAGGNLNGFLVETLPLLLTGIVGVIGGYTSGTIRNGTFAGLLTGLITIIADQARSVLMMVLAWYAIQHHIGPSGIAHDYQAFIQYTGHAPNLGTYVSYEYLQDGIGFPLITSLLLLVLEGLCATRHEADGSARRSGGRTRGAARYRRRAWRFPQLKPFASSSWRWRSICSRGLPPSNSTRSALRTACSV